MIIVSVLSNLNKVSGKYLEFSLLDVLSSSTYLLELSGTSENIPELSEQFNYFSVGSILSEKLSESFKSIQMILETSRIFLNIPKRHYRASQVMYNICSYKIKGMYTSSIYMKIYI